MMARLDVSSILMDPDFADQATLIRRTSSINSFGEHVLAETSTVITAVVQTGDPEMLARLPDGARLSDTIQVWYRGLLQAAQPGGYADVILWRGKRYQVHSVIEDFVNYGAGFTSAICLLEPVSV